MGFFTPCACASVPPSTWDELLALMSASFWNQEDNIISVCKIYIIAKYFFGPHAKLQTQRKTFCLVHPQLRNSGGEGSFGNIKTKFETLGSNFFQHGGADPENCGQLRHHHQQPPSSSATSLREGGALSRPSRAAGGVSMGSRGTATRWTWCRRWSSWWSRP